jgi:hypothetical protein
MDRLFPWFLFRGHFRSLAIRDEDSTRQNWPVTAVVYGLPFATLVFCSLLEQIWHLPVVLQKPGAVLSAAALLAGGTLAAFTHLSTLRLKLTERSIESKDTEQADRDMVDEVAIHLIMAALSSTFTALLLILGITFATGSTSTDEIRGPFAWMVFSALTFNGILYWIAFPRLFLTYVEINSVSKSMAGRS